MSIAFEAVVVKAERSAFLQLLETLDQSGRFVTFSLDAYSFSETGFVIFGQRVEGRGPIEAHETEVIAHTLSRSFGKAIAAHYDDQVGISTSMLSQEGSIVRYFGEDDEVLVPLIKGKFVTDGSRFKHDTVPDNIHCDVIWTALDAGLDAAGFRNWITDEELCNFPDEDKLIWHRPAG